jgi:diguanylate cyclase (GGDEF)-like protein/PAS domain S-box-containing protein
MVNQLIVRENSLSNLLQEAAQITSDYGKYQNIWIGKIDSERDKLKILTTADDNCDFIKSGKSHSLELANSVLNFKEELIEQEQDRLIINSCQNINEVKSLPENNCGSRAFFLLKALDQPWGVFSFCTAEENHFDKTEIKLLDELTGDISMGIEKIINEKRRKDSERRLKKSEKRFRNLFENSPVGIFKTTSEGNIEMFNPRMAVILGFESAAETITHYSNLGSDLYVNAERRDEFIREIKAKGTVNNFVLQAYDKKRNIVWLELNASIDEKKENGTFTIYGFCRDITERRKSEDKIKYLGFHDKLTGLYNRAFLEEEIKRVDTGRQLPISIIMGDLNNLKLINDTYGHQTGDRLIESAAEMIKNSCRDEDIIARWGGDEFVVLLPQTTVKESEEIIKRINQQIAEEEGELAVSISLGTASKTEKDKDLMTVLSKAEDRMYKNKISSRKSARSSVLSAFLTSLKEKSSETEEHVQRMSKMAKRFGEKV